MTEEKKQEKKPARHLAGGEVKKQEKKAEQEKPARQPVQRSPQGEGEEAKLPSTEAKVEDSKNTSLSQKLKDMIGAIEKMTLIELSELVKALEEKFGVSAAAPVVAAPGAASVAPKEAAEEKSSFEVVLTAIGDKKIQVIKEIRTITTLGLKEAKDLVEQAPQTVKKDVSKEEAEEIKKKLEGAGGKVEIK